MKKIKRFFTSVLTAGLLLAFSCVSVSAEPQEEYTYTVRFFSGNQGTFKGQPSVKSSADYSISGGGSQITVSGLRAGDVVTFDVQGGAVSMDASSKYYVKGVRVSGRDNNTVESSAFHVTEDRDYVVAYGIKGNVTGYTVNYQDEDGNELAPSRTYYGNVGDKPVVAHLYMEGYDPQALALTKTLSSNEAENVFTFTYKEVEAEVITQPGDTTTIIETETTEETEEGTGEGTGTGTDTEAEAGTDTEAGTGTETGTGTGTDEENVTDIEPEEVPQGNQDVVDLDEEETPLGNIKLDKEDVKKGLPFAAGIAMLVVAAAALTGLAVFAVKHRR